MRFISFPLIWAAILLLNVAGLFIGLANLAFGNSSYGARIFRTQNRAAASVLGFSGDHATSHECGKSDCRFCKLLCPFLAWALADPGHCEKEASR